MTILQDLVASYATTWVSMTPPQSFTMSDDSGVNGQMHQYSPYVPSITEVLQVCMDSEQRLLRDTTKLNSIPY
jgi:hypothetical protein